MEKERRPGPALEDDLGRYLETTLHTDARLKQWAEQSALPVFLTTLYRFRQAVIARRDCLFMLASEGAEATPKEIAKHVGLVQARFDGVVVYVGPGLTSTGRARLIEAGVPFVAPGKQLYIPQLAMDLRDYFRAPKKQHPDHLSPAAQVVLLNHILHPDLDAMTPGELAGPLRYSAMSIGRAFDELAAANLARVNRVGRRKEISFAAPPRLLLDLAKTLLVSPSRTERAVKWLGKPPRLPRAGLYGLAARTDISADEQRIYALTPARFTRLKEEGRLKEVRDAYDADAILQTWRYDPAALSSDDIVDPLSLYAEFWDNPDERIAYAAQKLAEELPQ